MTTIFINFRSGDGDWVAKLINNSLARRFGTDTSSCPATPSRSAPGTRTC